jgi:tRNA(Arg) A34 adenosine deaminase TadA
VGPAGRAPEAWAALPEAWQAAFREAWVSWGAGSLAAGAALAGPDGSLVTGRNAVLDHDRSVTPLAGTLMAHAEMTALARPPTGDYRGHELYTTFEPCVMCASTIRIYRIGRVDYASPDPIWEGLQEAFARLPSMARRLPERHLLGGALGVVGHALHLAAVWGRVDEHEWLIEQHAQCAPRQLGVARRLIEDGRLDRWSTEGRPVEEVVAALWSELSEAAATP